MYKNFYITGQENHTKHSYLTMYTVYKYGHYFLHIIFRGNNFTADIFDRKFIRFKLSSRSIRVNFAPRISKNQKNMEQKILNRYLIVNRIPIRIFIKEEKWIHKQDEWFFLKLPFCFVRDTIIISIQVESQRTLIVFSEPCSIR